MHPPFRPRPAARANPKNGLFSGNPQELRALSAAIDADPALASNRVTLAKMLGRRGGDTTGALADVDTALYGAWAAAGPADRLNAMRRALNALGRDLKEDTLQESLTGATEDGEATDRDLVGVSRAQAEGRVGAAERERQRDAMLASYGLAPELYKALIETSTTKAGERVKRPDDTAIAQQFGLSTKDVTTLRAAAAMLALHISREALMAADDLDDLIDALS